MNRAARSILVVLAATAFTWLVLFHLDEQRSAFPSVLFGLFLLGAVGLSKSKDLLAEIKELSIVKAMLILAIPLAVFARHPTYDGVPVIPVGVAFLFLVAKLSDFVRSKID